MARGAVWMLLLTFVDRSVGLVSTLILARLLVPADFGIVAMAWSFIFIAELLAAFGFDVALIHKQDATRRHFDTAWTMNVSLGAAIVILMMVAARPVSIFYAQPAVFWVICALAWSPLIAGFENIGVVAFRKDLDFRKEFAYQIIRRLVGFAVTVPLAFLLRNYWALVAGTLAARLAGTGASYFVHPYRPRFSLAEFASLFRFSRWLLLNNIVGFLKERSSDFVIGRLNGPAALGVYNVSYEVASMPTTALSAPINRALLPGFARIAGDAGSDASRVPKCHRHACADCFAGVRWNLCRRAVPGSGRARPEMARRRPADGNPRIQWRTAADPFVNLYGADRLGPSGPGREDQLVLRSRVAGSVHAAGSSIGRAGRCVRGVDGVHPLHASLSVAGQAQRRCSGVLSSCVRLFGLSWRGLRWPRWSD